MTLVKILTQVSLLFVWSKKIHRKWKRLLLRGKFSPSSPKMIGVKRPQGIEISTKILKKLSYRKKLKNLLKTHNQLSLLTSPPSPKNPNLSRYNSNVTKTKQKSVKQCATGTSVEPWRAKHVFGAKSSTRYSRWTMARKGPKRYAMSAVGIGIMKLSIILQNTFMTLIYDNKKH